MREGIGCDISDLVTETDQAEELKTMCLEFVSGSIIDEQSQLFRQDILDIVSEYLTENSHYVDSIVVDKEKVRLRFRRRDNMASYKDLDVCDLPPTLLEAGPDSYKSLVSLV